MLTGYQNILEYINEGLAELFPHGGAPKLAFLDMTPDAAFGDRSTSVAFAIAKHTGENPLAIAEKIADFFAEKGLPKELEKVQVARGGLLNFYFSRHFYTEALKEILEAKENFGKNSAYAGQKVMVEYTDPNPFKVFHIGHLMPNVIGESLTRLFEFAGAEVKRANYQGDIGQHVAKAIWGILATETAFPKDSDTLHEKMAYLGAAYALGSRKYDEDETAQQEMKEMNKKLFEKSDAKLNALYEKGRAWSLEHFEELYKKLGTKFDYYFFESDIFADGLKLVHEFLGKGVFKESDGAIIFTGEQYGLHTRVFVTSQGLPTYEAKELGLAAKKVETYPFDVSVVVTGNEQSDYYRVVLQTLEAMGGAYKEIRDKTTHIGHGMLRFATGKMGSRTGNVITGESLIADMEEMVRAKMADREIPVEEKEQIVEQIAVGAIKYSILKQAVGGDMIYDFEKSISFEGDSGPYLQYAHTRAASVLEKGEKENVTPLTSQPTEETIALERLLAHFPEVIARALQEFSPHYVVTYLAKLAGEFNSFYAHTKVLDGTPAAAYKLALVQAVEITLQNGLYILGIKIPKEM